MKDLTWLFQDQDYRSVSETVFRPERGANHLPKESMRYPWQEIMTKLHINKLTFSFLCQNFSITFDFLAHVVRFSGRVAGRLRRSIAPSCLRQPHHLNISGPDGGNAKAGIRGAQWITDTGKGEKTNCTLWAFKRKNEHAKEYWTEWKSTKILTTHSVSSRENF